MSSGGVTPTGSGHSGLRPEPASRLGHAASVPNARLSLCVEIGPDLEADTAGELLLTFFNDRARWGYSTQEFVRGEFRRVDGFPPLLARTVCCGCWANIPGEADRIQWWRSDALGLDVFLHWDGDGTVMIQHADWALENTDCKCSYGWAWVDADHWTADLPASYYEDEAA